MHKSGSIAPALRRGGPCGVGGGDGLEWGAVSWEMRNLCVVLVETGGGGVLFGSEEGGLANEDLSYCHWLMRIPTRVEHRSMNLGQAAAVVIYELGRRERITTENAESQQRTQRRGEKSAP